jgi:hypothetical protein
MIRDYMQLCLKIEIVFCGLVGSMTAAAAMTFVLVHGTFSFSILFD